MKRLFIILAKILLLVLFAMCLILFLGESDTMELWKLVLIKIFSGFGILGLIGLYGELTKIK